MFVLVSLHISITLCVVCCQVIILVVIATTKDIPVDVGSWHCYCDAIHLRLIYLEISAIQTDYVI